MVSTCSLLGYLEPSLEPDGSHFSRFVQMRGLACPSIAEFSQAYAQYLKHPLPV